MSPTGKDFCFDSGSMKLASSPLKFRCLMFRPVSPPCHAHTAGTRGTGCRPHAATLCSAPSSCTGRGEGAVGSGGIPGIHSFSRAATDPLTIFRVDHKPCKYIPLTKINVSQLTFPVARAPGAQLLRCPMEGKPRRRDSVFTSQD